MKPWLVMGLAVILSGCGDDIPAAPASAGADEARALDQAGQMLASPRPASSQSSDASPASPSG